jgi:diadenosine tetraphosphate (Ap4A) HIT family hydrolase
VTNATDACVVCALIRDGAARVNDELGRDELWRTDVVISYVCAPGHGSVDQVAVAPLRHVGSLLELSDAECAALLLAARDAGTALARVLDPDGLTLHAHIGAVEQQPTPHFEVMLGAKAFGSEFGELPREWHQEPWVLTDAVVADWDETFEQRVEIVAKLRAALLPLG